MARSTTHIACRAQVTPDCMDGQHVPLSIRDWRDDGTYRPASDDIVCDTCYVALMAWTPSGNALHDELDDAITRMRQHQRQARP